MDDFNGGFGGHVVIAGHTDKLPIYNQRFHSNWELSAARAIAVVKVLAESVEPARVSAAGFAEFQPRGDNETDDGRAANRRIEITLRIEDEG